jgi:hypothetical protein
LSLSEGTTAKDLLLTREGFYDIRRGNGQQDLVAVNADRRESDFEVIPKETLSLWQNTGEGVAANAGSVELERKPQSLWWYSMLVVLVLAIAESFVASRYLTARKEAA